MLTKSKFVENNLYENHIFKRVLSIQSHVVRGYLGNKAAVFTLQILGHHVDFINTVEFTSMYIHEGRLLDVNTLRILLKTLPLSKNQHTLNKTPGPLNDCQLAKTDADIDSCIDHGFILTGYISDCDLLKEILIFIELQKKKNNKLCWICDPVLGDNDKLYVPKNVADMYSGPLLKHVDILTPNQFELEYMANIKIYSIDDAINSCKLLHKLGPSIIIVTSLCFNDKNMLTLLASKKKNDSFELYTLQFPKIPIYLGGTGDVMAALILDGMDRFNGNIVKTCERAVQILQGLIKHSYESNPIECCDIDIVTGCHEILSPSTDVKLFASTYKCI